MMLRSGIRGNKSISSPSCGPFPRSAAIHKEFHKENET